METAGKLVDDDELREAMKDSGIGTPATRAAIIERLIDVGYIERDGRALAATEKGLNVIRLLDGHALTSPGMTGDWEHRLGRIEHGEETRERFMKDIAEFARGTVAELDAKLKEVRIPRANLGPCPVCGQDIVENRKGFSCWSREDPGCGFVIWKSKAGKTLPMAVAKELIATGRTARPVTGFKGRSGKSFRARLALQQTPDGKWRVEFDEPWAREGAKPPEGEDAAGAAERRPRPPQPPKPPSLLSGAPLHLDHDAADPRGDHDDGQADRDPVARAVGAAAGGLVVQGGVDQDPHAPEGDDDAGDEVSDLHEDLIGRRRRAHERRPRRPGVRAALGALRRRLGGRQLGEGRRARRRGRVAAAQRGPQLAGGLHEEGEGAAAAGAGSRSIGGDRGRGLPVLGRPGDVELGAGDQLGDLAREDEIGFGVVGGQVELRHGVLRGRLLAR